MSLFAIIFGFFVVATACGLFIRGSGLAKAVVGLMLAIGFTLVFIIAEGGADTNPLHLTTSLISKSLREETIWCLSGASIALIWLLVVEGTFERFLSHETTQQSAGPLGVRDELLVRLCLYAFQDSRRSILADLETALGASSGHRQQALQRLAAPGVRGMKHVNPESLVRTYRRDHDPSLATGTFIYSVICRLAVITGCNNAGTSKRLHRIGRAFGLARGEVNRAISLA